MDIRLFDLEESHRTDLEELLQQLSGKSRVVEIKKYVNVHCIGAFDGKRLLGFAQLFILHKTTFTMGYLEDVIVHEAYRGQGLGAGILQQVITTAKEEKCTVINLTTRMERTAARALFESQGFVDPGNMTLRLVL